MTGLTRHALSPHPRSPGGKAGAGARQAGYERPGAPHLGAVSRPAGWERRREAGVWRVGAGERQHLNTYGGVIDTAERVVGARKRRGRTDGVGWRDGVRRCGCLVSGEPAVPPPRLCRAPSSWETRSEIGAGRTASGPSWVRPWWPIRLGLPPQPRTGRVADGSTAGVPGRAGEAVNGQAPEQEGSASAPARKAREAREARETGA